MAGCTVPVRAGYALAFAMAVTGVTPAASQPASTSPSAAVRAPIGDVALTTSRPRRVGFRARIVREVHQVGRLRARASSMVFVDMPADQRLRFVAEYTVVAVDEVGRPTQERYVVEESELVVDGRPRPLLREGTVLDVDRTAERGRRLSVRGRFLPRARAELIEGLALPDLEDHAVDRASEPTGPVRVGASWTLPVDEIVAVLEFQLRRETRASQVEARATLRGPATVFGVPGHELQQQVVLHDVFPPLPGFTRVDATGSVDHMQRTVFFPADASLPPLRSETRYDNRYRATGFVEGTQTTVEGEVTLTLRESWLLP